MTDHVEPIVEHLFRRASGRVVGSLSRQFGPRHIEMAEDAVQEALVRALRFWPYRGVPDNPEAWLHRVARNAMIDALRREGRLRATDEGREIEAPDSKSGTSDELLEVMALCCDPGLAPDAQVALILKLVAGFSVQEIARAFLAREATIAQKLTRARRTIRQRYAHSDGSRDLIGDRIDAIAAALYLIFNEGYAMPSGDLQVSRGLCAEAIRLTSILNERAGVDRPEVDALLALMYFQAARLPARATTDGEILTLEEQDRSRWGQELISLGVDALNRSARGDRLTAYHLQAAIASFHSLAADYAGTDWHAILEHYDHLALMSDSPLITLNRCVALSMVEGPSAALRQIERLMQGGSLDRYALLYATAGELAWRCGDAGRAEAEFSRASDLVRTEPERRLIQRKVARLQVAAS